MLVKSVLLRSRMILVIPHSSYAHSVPVKTLLTAGKCPFQAAAARGKSRARLSTTREAGERHARERIRHDIYRLGVDRQVAIGGAIELTGIFLLSLDILAPAFRGATRRAAARRRQFRDWIQRQVAHMRGDVRHTVTAGGARAGGFSPTVIIGPSSATLEERLNALADHVAQLDARVGENEDRRAQDRAAGARAMAELREEVQEAIRRSESAYLPWRAVGFGLLR